MYGGEPEDEIGLWLVVWWGREQCLYACSSAFSDSSHGLMIRMCVRVRQGIEQASFIGSHIPQSLQKMAPPPPSLPSFPLLPLDPTESESHTHERRYRSVLVFGIHPSSPPNTPNILRATFVPLLYSLLPTQPAVGGRRREAFLFFYPRNTVLLLPRSLLGSGRGRTRARKCVWSSKRRSMHTYLP